MDTKIFLQGFKNKNSSNTSEGLNVSLKGKRKLLSLNDFDENISQFDQYREERNKCNIIRLTCQVNPICSNVLFNRITEVVHSEGSDTASCVNYGVIEDGLFDKVVFKKTDKDFWSGNAMSNYDNRNPYKKVTIVNRNGVSNSTIHITNSIRDTQLSNSLLGFVYHCGYDFFNNHLVRTNTFKSICKSKESEPTDIFNTIGDLMRDVNGEYVQENIYFPIDAGVENNTKTIGLHIYEYDDILSFDSCLNQRLIKHYNGWVGFYNKSKIKSYIDFLGDDKMEIERPVMSMNGGDFVDMYPDRSLYSFVPKFNQYRQRIEKNWNYCITYPSSSYTPSGESEPFSDIFETNDKLNSMKCIYFNENTRADNGVTQIVMYSIAKHGLGVGDYVNIYKTYKTKVDGVDKVVNEKILANAEVTAVADDYIFTVFGADIQISKYWASLKQEEMMEGGTFDATTDASHTYKIDDTRTFYTTDGSDFKYYIVNNEYVNIDDNAQRISYKKVVNDIDCEYYIRIFSKLPNFKYASGDTSNEYEIYRTRDNSGNTMLSIYQGHDYEFESHISKLAFAKNIYTDEVGEIVFTDDIDISNIHDNLGRPLTSLYLTFIKNNQGYKEWYGYDCTAWNYASQIRNERVEYSHCFGMISCGLDTCDESMNTKEVNSIHKIDNIDDTTPSGYTITNVINKAEDRRYYDSNIYSLRPQEVAYAQDKHYYGDLCYYDNYNAVERHIQFVNHRFNTAQRESYNSRSRDYFREFIYDEIAYDDYDTSEDYTIAMHKSDFVCNDKREGYYYIPHYEIPIKTFDKVEVAMPDFLRIQEIRKVRDNTYTIVSLDQHFLSIGDKAMIYDQEEGDYFDCVTVSGSGDTYYVFTCNVFEENSEKGFNGLLDRNLDDLRLFKMDNLDIPSYARILRDGSCRLIWRDVLNNGFNKSDDSVEEYPFTNGAFYINKSINIYVRRQDPQGYYGLRAADDVEGNESEIEIEDMNYKEEEITC